MTLAQSRYTGVIYLVTAACHAASAAYALSLDAPLLAIAMGLVAVTSFLAGPLFLAQSPYELARSPYAGALATGVARYWDGVGILFLLIIAVASLWTRALSEPTSVLFVVLLLAGCGACAKHATANAAQTLRTGRSE